MEPCAPNPCLKFDRLRETALQKNEFKYSFQKVKVAQSFPTLCDPMDYTFHGILQATILEWAAVPFSRRSSQHKD